MRVIGAVAVAVLVIGLAACEEDADVLMPDLIGKRLDVAQSDIERAGIKDEGEVLGGGLFGIVDESNWTVCEQSPAAGAVVSDPPRLTVDRSCGDEGAAGADDGESVADEPSAGASPEATETAEEPASAEAYEYAGPGYEVVSTDVGQGPASLTQYWLFTSEVDPSAVGYQDAVKAIITDIARSAGTDEMLVEVVTDREIALAESPSTMFDFIDEFGDDYFMNTIPEKEAEHWVASYVGGFDYDSFEVSSQDEAFEITWWLGPQVQFETWRPAYAD